MVHYGQSAAVLQTRSATLARAFARHPERFKGRQPQPPRLLPAVWINPPRDASQVLAGNIDLTGSSQSHDREDVQGTGTPENSSASVSALASSRSAVH